MAIQPSPAHAAVAKPMMPTEVRDLIAESIRSTSCWPNSPDTFDLDLQLDVGEQFGIARQHEAAGGETTMSNGNSAKIVK